MINILLVHQFSKHLVQGEVSALSKIFGGAEVSYTTTNPQNAEEHARDCERIKPTLVLLPFTFDLSISPQALGKGFRHVVVSAGEVSELYCSKPCFTLNRKPFEP